MLDDRASERLMDALGDEDQRDRENARWSDGEVEAPRRRPVPRRVYCLRCATPRQPNDATACVNCGRVPSPQEL